MLDIHNAVYTGSAVAALGTDSAVVTVAAAMLAIFVQYSRRKLDPPLRQFAASQKTR